MLSKGIASRVHIASALWDHALLGQAKKRLLSLGSAASGMYVWTLPSHVGRALMGNRKKVFGLSQMCLLHSLCQRTPLVVQLGVYCEYQR